MNAHKSQCSGRPSKARLGATWRLAQGRLERWWASDESGRCKPVQTQVGILHLPAVIGAFSIAALSVVATMPPKDSMARLTSTRTTPKTPSAILGFEAKLRLTADKLSNNMDATEYKHVVLGPVFLG